ncbi:MAG TPA: hypothetical protein VFR09_05060 [Alphaproteobacteria bacterium]|nr:hypothetical protein [Alphaproteobacteria bacterium]
MDIIKAVKELFQPRWTSKTYRSKETGLRYSLEAVEVAPNTFQLIDRTSGPGLGNMRRLPETGTVAFGACFGAMHDFERMMTECGHKMVAKGHRHHSRAPVPEGYKCQRNDQLRSPQTSPEAATL